MTQYRAKVKKNIISILNIKIISDLLKHNVYQRSGHNISDVYSTYIF